MAETVSAAVADSRELSAAAGFVWLATGLGVLHPYFRAEGRPYLERLGLPDWLMYVACAIEVVLGLRVLLGPARGWLAAVQVVAIAGFTLVLALLEPKLLVSPFGVLSKNGTLVAVILAAWLLEREGWSPLTTWTLRLGLAFIWVWEGLFANFLFQDQAVRDVIAKARLPVGDVGLFLKVAGVGEVLGGLAILVLRGQPLRWLLALQAFGLLVITALVTNYELRFWFHPFGPLTKNVPLILGTVILLRRTPAADGPAPPATPPGRAAGPR
jgi:uncharacterized membrane protein YphA (DoxX/SURF4 family)